jgi:hypothetical protein
MNGKSTSPAEKLRFEGPAQGAQALFKGAKQPFFHRGPSPRREAEIVFLLPSDWTTY